MTLTVYKQLATMQDLALGNGKVIQRRNGKDLELDKISIIGSVNNIADLRAIDYTLDDNAVFKVSGYLLATENRDWDFQWNSSDLSTEVAADTQSGIYVARNSDLTGASGAFVRQYSGSLYIEWFGANTTRLDNNIPIQAALVFANTNSIRSIRITHGVYQVSSNIMILGNNTTIKGASSGTAYNSLSTPSTVIRAIAGVTIIFDYITTIGTEGARECLLQDLDIDGNSIAEKGVYIAAQNTIDRCRIRGNTIAGVHMANFTNTMKITNCGLNQNPGVGLLVSGVSSTTYSVTDTNISLNTIGGVLLESGVGVNFTNVVIESNDGYGLKINKPNTHTNSMENFEFNNVWLEDNAATVGTYVLEINSGTSSPEYAPLKIDFKQCRLSCLTERELFNFNVTKWVKFTNCNISLETPVSATLVAITANAHHISFIENDYTGFSSSDNLSDAWYETIITTGQYNYRYESTHKTFVGVDSGVAFENSWANVGTPWEDASYYFDSDGLVHLQGSIKTGTLGIQAFTLPLGYRLAKQQAFIVNSNGAFGLVYVKTNGQVIMTTASQAITSLDGIVFSTQ